MHAATRTHSMPTLDRIHSKSHKCALCGKKFANFEQLRGHSSVHSGGRRGQSQASSRRFAPEVESLAPKVVLKEPLVLTEASDGLLQAQPKSRNVAQGSGRPHKCPACPAAFMKLSHLKQHHRQHTGERPFVCPVCERWAFFCRCCWFLRRTRWTLARRGDKYSCKSSRFDIDPVDHEWMSTRVSFDVIENREMRVEMCAYVLNVLILSIY